MSLSDEEIITIAKKVLSEMPPSYDEDQSDRASYKLKLCRAAIAADRAKGGEPVAIFRKSGPVEWLKQINYAYGPVTLYTRQPEAVPESHPLICYQCDDRMAVEAGIKAISKSFREALRRLTLAARTSGGASGSDDELMAACEQAEKALSLAGCAHAFYAAADRAAKLPSPPAAVPDGWKLVPVKPTMEMLAALGFNGDMDLAIGHAAICHGLQDQYIAMLAAAPAAPEVKPETTDRDYATIWRDEGFQRWLKDRSGGIPARDMAYCPECGRSQCPKANGGICNG